MRPPILLKTTRGMTLIEMLVAAGVLMVIGTGLVMGLAALQKNFNATTDYSTNHADEMRISDYIARDLRSATSVTTTGTGKATVVTMLVPNFYDSTGNPRTPTINGTNGMVSYQDNLTTPPATSGTVSYYLSGGSMYRTQNGTPTTLAVNVQNFQLTIIDSMTSSGSSAFNLPTSIAGKVAEIKTQISFSPTFSSMGTTANGIKSTTFYNTTLMRNTRTSGSNSVSLY